MPASPPSDSHPTDRDAGLSHRAAEGAIFLPDGRRVAAWPEVFLRTLHQNLATGTPETARRLLYRTGYEWGLQELLHLSHRIREESGDITDHGLWQTDAAVVFERWAAPLAVAGWGTWTVDRSTHASGIAVVELRHSAVAAALKSSTPPTEPVCHLYAGLFAGALSFYNRAETHALETACVALGHDCCRFLVAPGPVIDRAEASLREGATHDAILRVALAPPAPSPAAPPAPSVTTAPFAAKPANIPWGKK